MSDLTPVKAVWYRVRAKRLEREVGDLYHRCVRADPALKHPDTLPAMDRLAADVSACDAIARRLTTYLDQQP